MSKGCRDLPVHSMMLSPAGVSQLLLTDSAADFPVLLNTVLMLVSGSQLELGRKSFNFNIQPQDVAGGPKLSHI